LSAAQGLAWLGRHGSILLPAGVFLGILAPPLASALKPLLVPAIIGPFLIALVRLDAGRLRSHVTRPLPVVLGLLWLLVLAPLLTHAVLGLLPLPDSLHGALVLTAAASPLMASASLALIIGLDVALAVVLTVLATALMPVTLPPLALHLLGVEIEIRTLELMTRLALLVGGCFAAAWLLRRLLPAGFTTRHAASLDGLAIFGLLLFAIAIMDGFTALLLDRPRFVLLAVLAVFMLNPALQALASALFACRGPAEALTLGLCSDNRNLGLLLAALADRVSAELLIVIAAAQLPIYILPMLQRALYRRWLAPRTNREKPKEAAR
jgi:BASS family bile acid:Na+ symporter